MPKQAGRETITPVTPSFVHEGVKTLYEQAAGFRIATWVKHYAHVVY